MKGREERSPHARSEYSKIAGNIAARSRGEGTPGRQADAVADETNAAVGEQQVDPAGMIAAGGGECLVMAPVAAVPFANGVGRIIVVVKGVAEMPVDPLPAAIGGPCAVHGVAVSGRRIVAAGHFEDDDTWVGRQGAVGRQDAVAERAFGEGGGVGDAIGDVGDADGNLSEDAVAIWNREVTRNVP